MPADRTADVLQLLLESAESVGFIHVIKDKQYIDLSETASTRQAESEPSESDDSDKKIVPTVTRISSTVVSNERGSTSTREDVRADREVNARRVFVTHGKNRSFIEPVRKLLAFGELDAVVSVEKPSVSQPVPDKVMGEMRSCGAAIIHVEAEQRLIDADAKEHPVLNPNVLIEIGAAMALYGRRFILLVRDGVQLPSNLQGQFEVRYKGDALDGDATIRLLEAINDMKNHPAPLRYAKEPPDGTE